VADGVLVAVGAAGFVGDAVGFGVGLALGDADGVGLGVGAATTSGDSAAAGELGTSELAAAVAGSELAGSALTGTALNGDDALAAVPEPAVAVGPEEVRWLLVQAARVATQKTATTQRTARRGDRSCRAGAALVFRSRLAMDPG
jgi:hypothetical protein